LNTAITVFSAISFLAYGIGCFTSDHLRKEFVRFGLSQLRKVIGLLQICGSLGLLAGFRFPLLAQSAAVGLALMMLLAILVRIRIRDGFLKTTPAILYFLANAYLAFFAY
jgi:uncharacterized membrane protein YphA (DoxX/SURF4 family)